MGDLLKLAWVRFSLWFQNSIIGIVRFVLFKNNPEPKRILIFRTGSIGDNICAIPPVVSIRKHFPNASLYLMTDAGSQNVASLNSLLSKDYYDDVVDYAGMSLRQMFGLVKRGKYDLVIELPQNIVTLGLELRNMLFFRFAGIKAGFGWHITTCFTFLRTQEKHLKFETETRNLLSIISSYGVKRSETYYPLSVSSTDEEKVSKLLSEAGVEFNSCKIVAVVPGSKRPQNRYPFERFREITSWLVDKGYSVAVIGGPDDRDRGKELELNGKVVSFCGVLTPVQSAVMLSHCVAAISNDTGPMHLSYAMNTPVIGLFSSRDFQDKWFPPAPGIGLRNYDVHCSLCFSETCANNICIQGIPLQKVKESFISIESSFEK